MKLWNYLQDNLENKTTEVDEKKDFSTPRSENEKKIELEIIKRNELHTFKILPKRWIVERTFAWIDNNRRNSRGNDRARGQRPQRSEKNN